MIKDKAAMGSASMLAKSASVGNAASAVRMAYRVCLPEPLSVNWGFTETEALPVGPAGFASAMAASASLISSCATRTTSRRPSFTPAVP